MHIVRSKFKAKSGKIYHTVLLRESYREGKKVKKRTICNLSHCSEKEIKAIEFALKHKHTLTDLPCQNKPVIKQGLSIGSVWVVYQTAQRLGIIDALGNDREGQLALWQVIARVLEQGSRLSAVRLAKIYAISSTINLKRGFDEDDLYTNLSWLSAEQSKIEDRIFFTNQKQVPPSLFLYDVTSSYLEGEHNELAEWGYNRDKKKGKQQIVIGLLTSDDGTPITTEVFKGNTQDPASLQSQIQKCKERFHCQHVTFVGDRGMIKSGQIKQLEKHGFHYITAITKVQIQTLIKKNILQYNLFDDQLLEIEDDGIRYIIRRNPVRAEELSKTRSNKQTSIEKLVITQNTYLATHPRAKVETALKKINAKINKLNLQAWLSIDAQDRVLTTKVNHDALVDESRLDGCYVIKTDLPKADTSAQNIHDRYKDLAMVESAFRTVKSDLDIRPVYVRKEANTRGHVLVVMLAYMIVRELDKAWSRFYLKVEEGLRSLSNLTLLEISYDAEKTFHEIPEPQDQNKRLLDALNTNLPKILPKNSVRVVTKKSRRKSATRQ